MCTSSSDTSIVLAIFNLWIAKNGFEVKLDQLGNLSLAIPANHRVGGCRICSRGISSAAPLAKALPGEGLLLISENRLWVKSFFCSQRSSIVTLVETAIYVATVDKLGEVLKSLLDWVKEHKWESFTNCKKYKKKQGTLLGKPHFLWGGAGSLFSFILVFHSGRFCHKSRWWTPTASCTLPWKATGTRCGCKPTWDECCKAVLKESSELQLGKLGIL